jgi:hypothetical protein
MIQALVMILAFAALNRLRGSDVPFTSKGITSAVSGLTAGACAFWLGYGPVVAGLIGVVVFLGIFIWSIPGWGRFFSSFHGRDTRKEEEIRFIDRIGIAVFPHGDYWSNRKRGTLEMALRGLFLCPLFLVLGVVTWAGLLQGPVYFSSGILPEPWRVAFSEALWGGAMGLMVWLSLWMGV